MRTSFQFLTVPRETIASGSARVLPLTTSTWGEMNILSSLNEGRYVVVGARILVEIMSVASEAKSHQVWEPLLDVLDESNGHVNSLDLRFER